MLHVTVLRGWAHITRNIWLTGGVPGRAASAEFIATATADPAFCPAMAFWKLGTTPANENSTGAPRAWLLSNTGPSRLSLLG